MIETSFTPLQSFAGGLLIGGALPAISTGRTEVWVFVAALAAGIMLARYTTHARGPNIAAQNS